MPAKIYNNDDFILKMLAADDPQAINMLYEQHQSHLTHVINRYLRDPEATKDIVQDLFFVLWEHRHTIKISKPIKAYLVKAAVNRSLNYLRDTSRSKYYQLREVIDLERLQGTSRADEALELRELRDLIDKAFQKLPPKGKMVFILSREHHMSHKAIAARLGTSTKSVEKHISTTLRQLRIILKPYLKSILFLIGL